VEFREDNWANLVYISSFVYPKTQQEVADNWELENPENLLSPAVKAELRRLVQVRIMKKDDNGFRANLDSQPFKTEVKTFLSSHGEWKIPDNFEEYLKILRDDDNREKLLGAERVRHYYGNDPEKARKNPIILFAETIEVMKKKDQGLPVGESHNAKLAAAVDSYYSGL